MAEARIVYHGAAGSGGTLFKGMKLWLSHRVPQRDKFKEKVESNGGAVVLLEKKADIIIVDHARKDCPPGSVSWKWIEQSVRNGRLEDIEDHRAGPTHAQPREVGSTQPMKKTRTPFTGADDKILLEWVTRVERKGLPTLGNELYKQFAEKYPHHTWQSWLDRWKRYVSGYKRPSLPEEEEEDEEDDNPEPIQVPPKAKRPRHQPPVSRPAPRSASPPSVPLPSKSRTTPVSAPTTSMPRPVRPRSPPRPRLRKEAVAASPVVSERSYNSTLSLKANPFMLKSAGGNMFTVDESELLFEAYDAVMDLSDDQAIDAWIAWSVENPNHTPQEWRNHFKEYIIPTQQARMESEKAANQAKDMPPPRITPARKSAPNTSPAVPAAKLPFEIKDSQESSGHTVQTPVKEDEAIDSYTSSPREFEKNLLILADELELEVDPNPVIYGRTIPLFELWMVVHSNEFGGFDEVSGRQKWHKVARKLGFVAAQEREAGSDLQACYSEILCDLESAERNLQEGEDITSSQEAELIADQLQQTAEQSESLDGEEQYYSQDQEEEEPFVDINEEHEELLREQEENDDDLDCIQISPQLPSPPAGKRRLGNGLRGSNSPYHKRQRIDKGKGKAQLEIPSTPEDVINNTQTSRSAHQPSPLKFGHADPSSPSAASSIHDIQPIKLEWQRPAALQHPEPETQDFHHPGPIYPKLPAMDSDEEEDRETLPSIEGSPEEHVDEDDDEENLFVQQGPPSPPVPAPSKRNVSNSSARETAHSSSNNISNATTRATFHSSSNNYESSTQSQNESQDGAKVQAFIDKHVADGFAQDIITEALEATSMTVKEALTVMESLADGDGIPEDISGVWTKDDDEALEGGKGTAEYQRVIRKHGISRIRARKRFSEMMKACQEQMQG